MGPITTLMNIFYFSEEIKPETSGEWNATMPITAAVFVR
jgi:hypothetical protein